MTLKVEITHKAHKDLRNISTKYRERILDNLENLGESPFSGDVKKVKGMKGIYRRRVGDYRIFFSMDKSRETVTVYNISHRGKAYR